MELSEIVLVAVSL